MLLQSFRSQRAVPLRHSPTIDGQLVNKPVVDLGDGMDFFIGNAAAQRFRNEPDAAVIDYVQLIDQLVMAQSGKVVGKQAIMLRNG